MGPSDLEDRHNIAMASDLEIIQERNRNAAAAGRQNYNNLDLVDHDGLALDPPITREVDNSRINDRSYQQEQTRPKTGAKKQEQNLVKSKKVAEVLPYQEPDDKKSSTFMGSIGEDSEQKSDSEDKKKKKRLIEMFNEEGGPNEKKRKPKQQNQQPQIQITTDDSEDQTTRRSKKVGGKKKKKKKTVIYEEPMQNEYDPRNGGISSSDQAPQEFFPNRGPLPQQQQSYRPSNFEQFTRNFYPNNNQALMTGRSGYTTMRSAFEPQFITHNPMIANSNRQRMIMPEGQVALNNYQFEKWISKTTAQGFLYFHLKGTRTYQWNFPRYYDPDIKKDRPYFVDHWAKRYDNKGKKYYQNMHTKHIQHIKPDQETYLIQAAISGNLAFIELYVKSQGNLTITDQQKRNALHHSVSNGHREITALLCEFCYALMEAQDVKGCTPVFMAVRYNEAECLKLLISYDCNIYHKMKNGDTCLHVAAAYNSLESLILLTNFGGMELQLQRNRYELKAIEIARKTRNYEVFEVLQNLERNVQYQNAILEREVQTLDYAKGVKGGRSARLDYLGNGANYKPMLSNRKSGGVVQQKDVVVPALHLSNLRSHRQIPSPSRQQQMYQDDSSDNEPSLMMDEDEEAFEQLGGRDGYSKRVKDYQRKSNVITHQRDYEEKIRYDKSMKNKDKKDNLKIQHNLEFNDYRKKQSLRQINEEKYESSPKKGRRGTRTPPEEFTEEEEIRRGKKRDDGKYQKNHRGQVIEETEEEPHPVKSSRRDGNTSIRNQSLRMREEYLVSGRQRSQTERSSYDKQGFKNRFLHMQLANGVDAGDSEPTDQERDGNSRSRSKIRRANTGGSLGDPWTVSRSRDRRRKQEETEEEQEEKPSLVEIAYDKGTAIIETVRDLIVNGYSKVKQLVTRGKSRTSRSRRGRRGESQSDDSSLGRYKTPVGGRSKSRGFSKVLPIDSPEFQEVLNSEKED